MLKIGIITPFSNEFPFMARDFVRGIKLAFRNDEGVQFVDVETERGIPNEVSPLLRQLIITHEVNFIIGFLESTIVPPIKELIDRTQTPFIISGMGARLPLPVTEGGPNFFYNTFRMWESCWLMGQKAVQERGSRIGVFSSFFDGGFPLSYAHLRGAETVGGIPQFFALTHKENTEQELMRASQSLEQFPADYHFVTYYGKQRAEILDWFAQQGIGTEKLVTSSGIHPNGERPTFVTSWHHNDDTENNRAFCAAYRNAYGTEPDEFAMLGYENGLWSKEALKPADGVFRSEAFIEALKQARFEGPRGQVWVNEKTQPACADHLLVKTQAETTEKEINPLT